MEKTKNQKLLNWVREVAAMCKPDSIIWCDGSEEEYSRLIEESVKDGLAVKVEKRENCFLFRSDASDVARVESRTYIASKNQEDAGPTNNWIDPQFLKTEMKKLYDGCMRGRTMYVIPFCMGPLGSKNSKIGVEISDSAYVVLNMHIMTRVGRNVLDFLGEEGEFLPCLHSVGKPLLNGAKDNGQWPSAPIEKKYISHFPEERLIWSYGSGYGGNALLGKKCLALRIASAQARDEGWLAEHMLILKITNPEGVSKYIAAAFPSACGKTNLAMLIPTIKDWKIETVGDDIAWMRYGDDGRLYAVNAEAGFFGVAPGTSMQSNQNAMMTIKKNTIFTNVALTQDGDVWWEGIGYDALGKLIDWNGKEWIQNKSDKNQKQAAHPNSRFTVPAKQCPTIASNWEDPKGVPIDAILFGGRRPNVIPLVHQARSWNHGVFMGSIVGSMVTAAALDLKAGTIRRDPFAMLPFCGYHMGDYFKHWIEMGKKSTPEKQPKFFFVNWFRKNSDGRWLWPGFGENSRVLKWIFERCEGKANVVDTTIGFMPSQKDICKPESVSNRDMDELLAIDREGWKKELDDIRKNHYPLFGSKLPKELILELEKIEERLSFLS